MLVFVVVPGEKRSAKLPGIFDTAKSIREIRPVFQRLELRFGKRIIVTRMRPRVGFGYSQVGHQEGHGL